MNARTSMFLAALLGGGAALTGVACGDEETSTSSATTASTTTTTTTGGGAGGDATTTTSSAGGAGGGCEKPTLDCAGACAALYDCGTEEVGGMKLCDFSGEAAEKDLWLNGSMMNGCISTCEATPALKALVTPCDCGKTVTTLKGLNMTFKDTCETGLSGGAGGGGM